jgi:membrane associated rhomboid family serine protease
MARCDRCGEEVTMPYRCDRCGGVYCSEHRLPEDHGCPGLEDWNDPSGVFDSGFDDSVRNPGGESGGLRARIPVDTGPGSVFGYFRNNITYLFLALMWVTFAVQFGLSGLLGVPRGSQLWYDIFTLNTSNPEYVWTWFVSIFSHGGPTHILLNSIVLYFFGPVVERRVGSRKFVALFLAAGALAGLAQVGVQIATNPAVLGLPVGAPGSTAVLGASGAIAAVMGVLTVLNPNLRIYLYFFIPMPLWIATALFAGFAILSSTFGGVGAGGVAQVAHLAGLALGVAYGYYLKRQGERGPENLQFGGGPGMGRGPGGPGGPGGRI